MNRFNRVAGGMMNVVRGARAQAFNIVSSEYADMADSQYGVQGGGDLLEDHPKLGDPLRIVGELAMMLVRPPGCVAAALPPATMSAPPIPAAPAETATLPPAPPFDAPATTLAVLPAERPAPATASMLPPCAANDAPADTVT